MASKEVRGAYLQDMHIFNGHPEMLMRQELTEEIARGDLVTIIMRPIRGKASVFKLNNISQYHCLEGVFYQLFRYH